MSERNKQSTQSIDPNLMESLDRLKPAETGSSEWFTHETEKKPNFLLSLFQKKKAPPKTPIEPTPFAEETSKSIPQSRNNPHRNSVVVYLPLLIFLSFVMLSFLSDTLGFPFLAGTLETGVYVVLAIATIPSMTILGLLHIAKLREKYIFKSPEKNSSSSVVKDFIFPVALLLWLLSIVLICTVLLLSFSGNETIFNTFLGLSLYLLIVGPIALIESFIVFIVVVFYRKGFNVQLPEFIQRSIEYTWRTLHQEK